MGGLRWFYVGAVGGPGAVSDLRTWNYTLNPNQVSALYQQIP
ncbi:hypothetical protein [Actinacidiphila yeochonensis]|nr:hypothetical protein [Actinacidiphila yeochonensis]